jgi:cyclopropane fatty-acyl-phospholipid synthase-like methyltransferase
MNDQLTLRDYWEKGYESSATPFDIDEPDEWIAEQEKLGKIRGHVLDSGCGPGRTALYLAGLGYRVTGTDISLNAIERAKQKAVQKNLTVEFLQADMCTFSVNGNDKLFDTVIDIGCFHSLFEESARQDYAAVLHRSCQDGAVIYLRAFSNANSQGYHHSGGKLPALSDEQIRTAFSVNNWNITNLEHREINLRLHNNQTKKAYCWFAEMKHVKINH